MIKYLIISACLLITPHVMAQDCAALYMVMGDDSGGVTIDDYISQWRMNDDLATTAVLDTKSANVGALQGGDNTATISVAGKINKALNLNGSDDYIDLGTNSTLKPSTGDMSWSMWLDPDIDNSGDAFIADRELGTLGTKEGYALGGGGGTSSGNFAALIEASNGQYKLYQKTGFYTQSEGYFHIVVTWKNSTDTLKIYKDGVDLTSTFSKTKDDILTGDSIANGTQTVIGRRPLGSGRFFNGQIDETRIYSYELDQDKIDAIYNSGNGTE